jgi:hypothetical protein
LQKPRHTKASKKAAQATKEKTKQKEEPKAQFKMSRFKNVNGRTDTHLPEKKKAGAKVVEDKKPEVVKEAVEEPKKEEPIENQS